MQYSLKRLTSGLSMTLAIAGLFAATAAAEPSAAPKGTSAPEDTSLVARTTGAIGTNVENGLEWVQRRRTFVMNGVPYGFTALPIVFYAPSGDFHYGAWAELANYARRPYRYRINVQWWLSTQGKRQHYIRFDFPSLIGLADDVRFRTEDARDTGANFFGLGNKTRIEKSILDTVPDYYRYQFERQRTAIDIEKGIGRSSTIYLGARFARGTPSRIDQTKNTYFLFRQTDVTGVSAGWTNSAVIGIIADTRDDREFPTRGFLSEISLQQGLRFLGSDYGYRQTTIVHTHYVKHGPRNMLVFRFILEGIDGRAPFYEFSEVGGSIRASEVVGGAALRGYRSRRFADRDKLLTTTEYRRNFSSGRWRGQFVQAQIIGFVDAGQVAARWKDLSWWDMHTSAGAGLRGVWNSQLSIRADYAVSPEERRFLLSFGNQF